MAIYQNPDGTWRNTDNEEYGSEGAAYGSEYEARSAGQGGGGDGGGEPIAQYDPERTPIGALPPVSAPEPASPTLPGYSEDVSSELAARYYSDQFGVGIDQARTQLQAPENASWKASAVGMAGAGQLDRYLSAPQPAQPPAQPAQAARPAQPAQPAAAGNGQMRTLLGPDGRPISVNPTDYAKIEGDLRNINDLKRKQIDFENNLKTQDAARAEKQVKVSEMLAQAEVAYKQALIEGASADRAQRAAEAAMEANYKAQSLALQQQQYSARIALDQRQAQAQRRARRPFAPRARVNIQ